jgi:hypothetical protein
MFQVQFTELCTIIPSHFTWMPGLRPGTKALDLVDPVVRQEVGLFWAGGETIMPMANALVAIVESLNKTGALRRRLGDPTVGPIKSITRDTRVAANGAGRASRRSTRA